MAQRKTLTEKQVAVLRWIGDGCPDGVMEGDSHRISAAALRGRGLVTTNGRGPSWTASITTAGQEYIARCDGPNPPTPRQANGSVTEKLVNDVVAAGGSLTVPRGGYMGPGDVDYEHRAALAERYGKVPDGKQLVVHRLPSQERRIDLVEAPNRTALPKEQVPVPGRLTKPHPVVAAFRNVSDTLELSRAIVPRAARILQGLVAEAERRSYTATACGRASNENRQGSRRSRTGGSGGVMAISVDGFAWEVMISEQGLPSRGYWEQRNGTYRHNPRGLGEWVPPPPSKYEAKATGLLTLSLVEDYSFSGRPRSWSDRKNWTVEDKLPELLREIEYRAREAREREREKQRQAAERERAWKLAMDRARDQFLEQHRGKALADQVERWQRSESIRAFCVAAEEAHPDSTDTAKWVAWARDYSDSIDPLREPPQAPSDPEKVAPTTSSLSSATGAHMVHLAGRGRSLHQRGSSGAWHGEY